MLHTSILPVAIALARSLRLPVTVVGVNYPEESVPDGNAAVPDLASSGTRAHLELLVERFLAAGLKAGLEVLDGAWL